MLKNKKRVISVILMLALMITSLVFTTVGASAADETTYTATIDYTSYENKASLDGVVKTDGEVSIVMDKNGGSTAPTYYTSGSAVRVYGSNTVTISVSSGYEIVSIVVNANASTYLKDGNHSIANGSVTNGLNSKAVTITPDDGTADVVIKNTLSSGNIRFSSIVVTYKKVVSGSACDHANATNVDAVAATCTDAGYTAGVYCPDCETYTSGYEKINALGHSYDDGVVNPAATCTTAGVKTYTCSVCNGTKTEEIVALGHTFDGNTCSVCGAEKPSEVTITFDANKTQRTEYSTSKQVWKNGDLVFTNNKGSSTSNVADYGNPVRLYASSNIVIEFAGMTALKFDTTGVGTEYITALTNTLDKYKATYNFTYTTEVSGTKTVAFHLIFANPVDSITMTLQGQVRLAGITAYAVKASAPECTEHTWVDATCTAPKTCSVCNATEGEALAHVDANGDFKCDSNCGAVVAPKNGEALSIVEANKLGVAHAHNGYTSNKYYVTGVITSIVSTDWGNLYIEDENGNTFYIYGYYSFDGSTRYDALEYKPVVGDEVTVYGIIGQYNGTAQMKSAWQDEVVQHAHMYDNCIDATCNLCGDTREPGTHVYGNCTDTTCNACGDTREPGTHEYDNSCDTTCNECGEVRAISHTAGAAATCTTAQTCTVCGAELVAALGHSHNAVVTEPDCVNGGYTTYTCACGDSYVGDETAALGHTWVAGEVKAPTCTEDGYTNYACACGATKTDDATEATGHATETEYWAYNNKLYLVPVCGCMSEKVLVDTTNALPVTNEEDLVFLLTHGFNVKLDADIDLTATIDIYGAIVTLDLNGKTLKADWESDGVVEVIHVYEASHLTIIGEGNVISGGTYTAGTNSVISCRIYSMLTIKGGNYYSASHGDVIFCETSSIVRIEGGHFEAAESYYGSWYVLDIDESESYNRGQFIVTGGTFVNFDPANHTNDADYTNKVADGYHSINNNGVYTVGAHSYNAVVIAPTCEAAGYTAHTCACGDTYTTDETAALGHNYESVVTPPTYEAQGYTTHTCSNCGDSYVDSYVEALAVAQIGDVKYGTLADAINAAQTGDTLTLLADINLGNITSAIVIKKSITIDGQGIYTINVNYVNDTFNKAVFTPRGPISYGFKNVTINLNNAAADMAAFNMKYGGTLENVTVNGTFGQVVSVTMAYSVSVTNCEFNGATWGVYASSSNVKVNVTGTTFNTTGAVYLHQYGELVFTGNILSADTYVETNATVDVSKNFWNGNNVIGGAPAAEQLKGSNIICDNYYATNTDGVLGDLTNNGEAETPVIKIELDGVVYEFGASKLTLINKLLNSSNKSTDVKITLLDNVTLADGLQIAAYWEYVDEMVITPKAVEIDLNGKTLTGFIQINANVTATIKNGTIINTHSTYGAIDLVGKATLNNVTLESAKAVSASSDAELVVGAKIGNTYFATLQDAIDAAVSGDTIVLLADVVASKYIDIKTANNGETCRTLTLDLNGHSIAPAAGYNYNSGYPLVFVGINQTLTIKGEGTITADKKVTVGVYGTLYLEGGTIVNKGTTDEDAALDIYYWNHDLPSYEGIVGGTGVVNGGHIDGAVYMDPADEDGSASLVINGGTFTTDVTEYCAPGFVAVKGEDGKFGIVVDPSYGKSVQVGDNYYDSLAEAIAAANDGDTIKLLEDATVGALAIVKNIKLDLNGKTLTAASLVLFDDNAAVVDSGDIKGLLVVAQNRLVANQQNSKVVPVWTGEGYKFTTVKDQYRTVSTTSNGFVVEFRPDASEGDLDNTIFANGAADNALSFKVRIRCYDDQGNVVGVFDYAVSDEVIESVYTNGTTIRFTLKGAGSTYANYGISFVVESNCGILYDNIVGYFANGNLTFDK